jgi:hypothetical protein
VYKLILNFFYFSFFTIFIFQTGSYLSFKLKNKIIGEYRSLNFLFGIFLIGSTIVAVNFFLPTSSYLTYALLLIFFILSYKAIIPAKYILKIILINLIIYPICLKMSFAFDAGLYHLPYQDILRNEKIIFGLANIHGYGISSFQEYLGSIVFSSNFIFHKFIIGSFLSFFCLFLDDLRKTKLNFDNIFFYYTLLSLPFLSRYFVINTTLTDLSSGLLLVVQFYFAIKIFLLSNIKKEINVDNIQIFILLTFLSVAFKASSLLSVVLFFIIIILSVKSVEFLKLIIFKNIFIFVLIFFWLLKNIIISGCIVYPIEISCFEFFDWNASESAGELRLAGMSFNRQPFADFETTLYSNDWFFNYWIKTFDKFLLSILFLLFLIFIFNFIFASFKEKEKIHNFFYVLFPFIILLTFQSETFDLIKVFFNFKIYLVFGFLSLVFSILIFYNRYQIIIKNISNNYKYSLIFFSYICLAISLWFYNAPNPRFALGYFFSLFIFFGFFMHIAFNGSALIFDLSNNFRIKNLFHLYFFMIIIFSQLGHSYVYVKDPKKNLTFQTVGTASVHYSFYNFFNNSFWTQKIHTIYFNKYDVPNMGLIKRKNFGFSPNGPGCWLTKKCYYGADVQKHSMPLNYIKLKRAKN